MLTPFEGINVQDITKLKVRLTEPKLTPYASVSDLDLQSAAINTIFGVIMTTRRQMLKIKVMLSHISLRFSAINRAYNQGMSEAKVEKIKEAAQKIAVCLSGAYCRHCSSTKLLARGPHLRLVLKFKINVKRFSLSALGASSSTEF